MYSFDGILGSSYALFAVSFSYVADITYKDNHRVLGVVIIESVLMVTAVCGSLLSGYFIETLGFGFFNTAVICSALMLLGFAITLLFLPETLHKNKRSSPKSFLGTWKKMIQFYISADFRGKRTLYILLLGSFFVTEIAMLNRSNIETLYFLGQPFCWGPSKIGVFATTRYVALGVVGLGSLPLLQKFLSNEIIAVISAVSSVISLIIEGLAKSNLMIYLVPVTGAFSFVMVPIIRGMMSTMTEPDKQGAMFSSVATIEVLSSISAALLLNEIYAETYSFMNGFVFLVMAGFCVITCILLSAVYYLKKCKNGNYVKPVYETVKVMNNHNVKNDTRNNVTSC
jgi:PCFT/HCP family folate transporter-like MFS transporter 1/3